MADRGIDPRDDQQGEEREHRIDPQRHDKHSHQRQCTLRKGKWGDGHCSIHPCLEVDSVHELAAGEVVVKRLGETLAMAEEVTPDVKSYREIDLGIDVRSEHGDALDEKGEEEPTGDSNQDEVEVVGAHQSADESRWGVMTQAAVD